MDGHRAGPAHGAAAKVVERKISRGRYLLAFLITAGIFALGLLLGLVIEGKRIDLITFKDQEQKLDFQSLQLQYQFVDQFTKERNCDGLRNTFDRSLRTLEVTREKVENYRKDATLNTREFDLLKREYTLAQISYWMLYLRAKEVCSLDAAVILYFFAAEEDCRACDEQAVILTWLKHKLDMKLLNFVFDGEYDEYEPIIGLLKERYGVRSYPTIVVNGKAMSGLTEKETILREICPVYTDEEADVCGPYR